MKEILLHIFLYIFTCCIGAFQIPLFSLIYSLFTQGNIGNILNDNFGLFVFILMIILVMSLPVYIICLFFLLKSKSRNPISYVICGVLTASSPFILANITNLSLSDFLRLISMALCGVIPGLTYYYLYRLFLIKTGKINLKTK